VRLRSSLVVGNIVVIMVGMVYITVVTLFVDSLVVSYCTCCIPL
jgi:hypothetical protein